MSTPQQPLGSGFGAASTTDDVLAGLDLGGKVAVVTGGYSGLGAETVRALTTAGAAVVVPARDPARAQRALTGVPRVSVEPMDLLDPASVDAFAARFLAGHERLDILVNSAGIMAAPLRRDARGHESHFATNHLGHFQLTGRLYPRLRATAGARVVSVTSAGHRYSPVVFEDLDFAHRDYEPFAAYGQSKTANALFAVELDRRGAADDVRAFAVHPGTIVGTGLEEHVPVETLVSMGVLRPDGTPVLDPARNLKTVPQGAATAVWCATSPQLAGLGGVYCENCDVAELAPDPVPGAPDVPRPRGVYRYAIDPQNAARLWEVSERLVCVAFP